MKIIPLFARLDKGSAKGALLFALKSISNNCHRLSAADKFPLSFMRHHHFISADIAFILLSPFGCHRDSPFFPISVVIII